MKFKTIRRKLIAGFLFISLLTAVVGVSAIIGLQMLSSDSQKIDAVGSKALQVSSLQVNINNQRATYRGAALKDAYNLYDMTLSDLVLLDDLDQECRNLLSDLRSIYTQPDEIILLNNISEKYEIFSAHRQNLADILQQRAAKDQIEASLFSLTEPLENTIDAINDLIDYTTEQSTTIASASKARASSLTFFLSIIVLLSVGGAIALGMVFSLSISRPVEKMAQASRKLSSGDVNVELSIEGEREISALALAFLEMAEHIQQQANALTLVSKGNFTVALPVRSAVDIMNMAINELVQQNNQILSGIRDSSGQVNTAVEQIAEAAQDLSLGATEQAASLQQFSASVTDMHQKFIENTKISKETLANVKHTKEIMDKSDHSLKEMEQAMREITQSSMDIAKVIKVIEDISFQTNILALNAAVEAARAGQHGKGFAVVADEVRNLAAKTADAVRETSALIQQDEEIITNSNKIVESTLRRIQKVNEITAQNTTGIVKISETSLEQSAVMDEFTQNIYEISGVVQNTSASAEEIASATHEILSQTASLISMTDHFKLDDESPSPPHQTSMALLD